MKIKPYLRHIGKTQKWLAEELSKSELAHARGIKLSSLEILVSRWASGAVPSLEWLIEVRRICGHMVDAEDFLPEQGVSEVK